MITMNHHPTHTNNWYAENESPIGQPLVVGNLVYSLVLGMSVPDVSGAAIANLEVETLRHAKPTFHGDTIYAVIKGSAINNDGSVKVGYLAPGVEGQVDAIREALKASRLSARDISYVEAHGTGTSVGDPIELTALDQAFSEQTSDTQFCGVGSVKSNIGHLGEAAAGASLIKVALALKNKKIPPSLGYEKPNPRFPLGLYIADGVMF